MERLLCIVDIHCFVLTSSQGLASFLMILFHCSFDLVVHYQKALIDLKSHSLAKNWRSLFNVHTKERNIQNEGEYSKYPNWQISWQGGRYQNIQKLSIQTTQNVRQGKIFIASEFMEITWGRKCLQNYDQTQQNTYSFKCKEFALIFLFIIFCWISELCKIWLEFMPLCLLISSLLGILIT